LEVLEKIKALENISDFTKQERILQGIKSALEDDTISYGDQLPSVNKMAKEIGVARETVVKAYKVLRDRGIVKSKHGVGYYISTIDTAQQMSVALVLYGFQTFQQTFYNTFRKSLGKNHNIDVFFHHNNPSIYKSILNQIQGKYGYYVLAPIENYSIDEMNVVSSLGRTLIIDRFQDFGNDVSYITQEFKNSSRSVLDLLESRIKDFDKLVLFFKSSADYPEGIRTAVVEFCQANDIPLEIQEDYELGSVEKSNLYLTVGDADLWSLLKDCKTNKFNLGSDVGVLSHNDSPVKEIIEDGITTFSTDFSVMAEMAAEHILSKQKIRKVIPTKLIRRKSL